MASDPDESNSTTDRDADSATVYELMCSDCDFEMTVTEGVYAALDVAKAHRENEAAEGHFVNFEIARE